jgi:hypothetical protein
MSRAHEKNWYAHVKRSLEQRTPEDRYVVITSFSGHTSVAGTLYKEGSEAYITIVKTNGDEMYRDTLLSIWDIKKNKFVYIMNEIDEFEWVSDSVVTELMKTQKEEIKRLDAERKIQHEKENRRINEEMQKKLRLEECLEIKYNNYVKDCIERGKMQVMSIGEFGMQLGGWKSIEHDNRGFLKGKDLGII